MILQYRKLPEDGHLQDTRPTYMKASEHAGPSGHQHAARGL